MEVRSRMRDTASLEATVRSARPVHPGVTVLLRRPLRLRGTTAIVRRRMTHGWEVEIRSANGLPMHLTLPERALRLR